ncbi:MAG: ribonuclease III [Clostridiales bacterium]|jgi:ribonuclease-3|nr:ribonuclease III [Clostridiales bacterium]
MDFEKIIGYKFKNPAILENALVHTSYVNENKISPRIHNERLEFLGDAVLELVTSCYIFTNFPNLSEGEMTRLRAGVVCEPSLAKCARAISLGEFIKMGKGEVSGGGRDRDSVLSDAYEAVIGAIYTDGGYEPARDFILAALKDDIHSKKGLRWIADCKTHLQEQLQRYSQAPIEYYVIKEEGPEHEKVFTVELAHEGRILAQGVGRNKKEAEQAAARFAIEDNGLY